VVDSYFVYVNVCKWSTVSKINLRIWVQFPAEAKNVCLLHTVQTGSAAHPDFYPIRTEGSFLAGKVVKSEVDHLFITSSEV
jgi:hypothetical protein